MSKIECSGCGNEPKGKINVTRMLKRLDECFAKNDLDEAKRTLLFWENEAVALNDECGLLAVFNEELGLYRTLGDEALAMQAVKRVEAMLDSETEIDISRATVFVNLATTLKAFGKPNEGIKYFDKAEEVFVSAGKTDGYEYAALLNNRATALCDLQKYAEAERCYKRAIAVLEKEGRHDADIGISYIGLAHLIFDRDEDYATTEVTLDKAWDMLTSDRQPHDAEYAAAIMKCVPSLRFFKRDLEADALEETAKEIYAGA